VHARVRLKYEIEALANKDFRYLHRKLKEEDWSD